MFKCNARFYRLEYCKQSAVVGCCKPCFEVIVRYRARIECVKRDLRTAHRFHQRIFKRRRDSHNFACRFHLRAEFSGGTHKLVERPFRELYHNVVKRGFKARTGLARYIVFDFVESVAERDFCRYLRDGVARRFRCKRRRARNSRIDLDHRIIKTVRVKRELAVTAADYSERGNDVQRRRTEHLIFFVRKRQRGCDNDAVARVYSDRVEVFH